METKKPNNPEGKKTALNGFVAKHPILVNLLIIILVAILGVLITYMSIAIFTKHGRSQRVPGVENLSYTEAIKTLTDAGFRVEIRDSIYNPDGKPGYVTEQFPKRNSVVKPGRKIFLYINSVHPKEVVIDDDNHPTQYALKDMSERQGIFHLQELGFTNIKVVKVLGEHDCIVRVLVNGRPVRKMQKVPVNAQLVLEVYDGRLKFLRDSLQDIELRENPLRNTYYDDMEGIDISNPDYIPPYQPEDPNEGANGSKKENEGESMESNSELFLE